MTDLLRPRQLHGKYRIEKRFAQGAFADIYRATDTIEGITVALKIPHGKHISEDLLSDFRKEAQIMAKLDHPNILPVKTADFIEGKFTIVYPIGERSLADRIRSRMSLRTALQFTEQILEAMAYAHSKRVIHCDVKPENMILFPGNKLRLTDFGIARIAHRTQAASGSGTVGYIAPEQAMGQPSFRSDVFSGGLVIYRMLTGHLPEWPFDWPPPGHDRLKEKVHPDMIGFLRRSLEVISKKRFRDGTHMLSSFRKLKVRTLRSWTRSVRKRTKTDTMSTRDWRQIRMLQFKRQYGKELETHHTCRSCEGPVAESMQACPWCCAEDPVTRGETRHPEYCARCGRGMKLDWRFCPWCHGPGYEVSTNRQYSDTRYTERCGNAKCSRGDLFPFMRYCPWCRAKTKQPWKIPGARSRCKHCSWGVAGEYWDHCPWCSRTLNSR